MQHQIQGKGCSIAVSKPVTTADMRRKTSSKLSGSRERLTVNIAESTQKGVNQRPKDVTQVQQRPKSPAVALTWHACKYTYINSTRGKSRFRVQELRESRGGRPGLSVLTSLMVSVNVKQY